ncbi:MAG TPA: hypothetical protein DIT54_06990 [Lachnospiraceae bacterium]|nr:hypothetical protein [Lachnospiraceae bacterium]
MMADEKRLEQKEEQLKERLERIQQLEQEILEKEKAMKLKEKAKKQIVLRLAPSLWEEIARWAEEDFRSINGQIEYILTEAVRNKKKK